MSTCARKRKTKKPIPDILESFGGFVTIQKVENACIKDIQDIQDIQKTNTEIAKPTKPLVEIDDLDSLWDIFKNIKIDAENITNSSDIEPKLHCPYCNSDNVAIEESEYVCLACHSVLDKHIDMSPEWRCFGGDDGKYTDASRVGMPHNPLLPNSSLGTVMGGYGFGESYEMRIVRRYHQWNTIAYKERSLLNIFDSLSINATNNGLPKTIIETAKFYYKSLSKMKITRGNNRCGLIASSIYMSCKQHKVPRSTKEVANIFNMNVVTMTKGCKRFSELMKIHLESSTPADFINRFCSRLSLNNVVRNMAMHIVTVADELNIICDSTPPSIAAAAIYFSIVENQAIVNKKDLATACEISQVTINKCYKKLLVYRSLLM